jgi:uncharacterized protein YceK
MKAFLLLMVASCVLLGGCAGVHPDHEDCVGPRGYCDVYSN